MRLVDLIRKESSAEFDQIMLLRHSNDNIDKLIARGGSVEEYTFIQPIDSDYDYWTRGKPRITSEGAKTFFEN